MRYHTHMKTEPERSSEFDKFDRLVGQVLSVPKPEIERIKADEQKAKETSSPTSSEVPSRERRLQDLAYLKRELEEEEARKSQIIKPTQDTPHVLGKVK